MEISRKNWRGMSMDELELQLNLKAQKPSEKSTFCFDVGLMHVALLLLVYLESEVSMIAIQSSYKTCFVGAEIRMTRYYG
jgi:hypothetical protein